MRKTAASLTIACLLGALGGVAGAGKWEPANISYAKAAERRGEHVHYKDNRDSIVGGRIMPTVPYVYKPSMLDKLFNRAPKPFKQ